MIPGPDLVLECPRCGAYARLFTLISGNTFGAQTWTDGRIVAPMLPQPPEVTRCRVCGDFYWVAQARRAGEIPPGISPEEAKLLEPRWLSAPPIGELEVDEYWEALRSNLAPDPERERRLRLLAWWRSNDPMRKPGGSPAGFQSEEARRNARALLPLLREQIPEDLLFRAEILRQLGAFPEALKELEKVTEPRLQAAADRIGALAEQRSSRLALVESA